MDETTWRQILADAGGVFPDEAGGDSSAPRTPLHYGDPLAEFEAGRNGAALFDVSDRTQIELTGGDRAAFLHNFCTNDVNRLQPGDGCEAFVTSVKGRVLGHIFVFAEENSLWIESAADAEAPLLAHLDRYLITEDVELHGRTEEFGELFVTGPQAEAVLKEAGLPGDRKSSGTHAIVSQWRDIASLRIRRVDWFETPGFLLCVPRDRLSSLWKHLSETGVIRPAGSKAFHVLRIEAGFPLHGADISEENLAQEVARTRKAVSFTKGCYLGQEPIARLDAMGHVNRELRTLKLQPGPAPDVGAAIFSPEDGKEIGRVTSVGQLTSDHAPVALGYVRSRFSPPGTEVTVAVGENRVPAMVSWKNGA